MTGTLEFLNYSPSQFSPLQPADAVLSTVFLWVDEALFNPNASYRIRQTDTGITFTERWEPPSSVTVRSQFDLRGEGLSIASDGTVSGTVDELRIRLPGPEVGRLGHAFTLKDISVDAGALIDALNAAVDTERNSLERRPLYDLLMSDITRYEGTGTPDAMEPESAIKQYFLRGGDDLFSALGIAPLTDLDGAHVDGGRGEDRLWFDSHDDTRVDMEAGTVRVAESDGTVYRFTFESFEVVFGADQVNGSSRDDIMSGSLVRGRAGDDSITGTPDKDRLIGGAGDDRLFGGNASDTLRGGAGRDRLNGGGQDDILTGGSGGDIFVFEDRTGLDTITDFNGAKDRLRIEASLIGDRALEELLSDTDAGLRLRWDKGQGVILEDQTVESFDIQSISLF